MSIQRNLFEMEVRKPQPDWASAVDNLSALAMFEMLPALAGLSPEKRKETVKKSWEILSVQRQWKGAFDRIDFAADVINDQRITSTPKDLAEDQIEDARKFLIVLLKVKITSSKAGRELFSTADAAAIEGILEIIALSIAISREFSGSIFQRAGRFGFTPPVRGNERDSDPNVAVPAGSTAVGYYHTHGSVRDGGGEIFSIDDINACKKLGRFGYLGTPSGRIKKIIPANLLPLKEQKENILGFKQVHLR